MRQPPGSGGGYGGSQGADRGAQHNRGFWPSARDEADIGRRQDSLGPASGLRRPGSGGEGLHRGRGPRGYTRSEERIREDVNEILTRDGWVDASEIEVLVQGGEVTLSGRVSHGGERRRAEDLVHAVSGVKHVQNNIRIGNASAAAGDGTATAVSALADTSTGQKSSLGSDALAREPRPPRRQS